MILVMMWLMVDITTCEYNGMECFMSYAVQNDLMLSESHF